MDPSAPRAHSPRPTPTTRHEPDPRPASPMTRPAAPALVRPSERSAHIRYAVRIVLALAALVDRGDNVLVPSPGYPLYDAALAKLDVENVPYYLDESNGWQPDVDDIKRRITPRTRAIVVINPNNPTGSLASRATL